MKITLDLTEREFTTIENLIKDAKAKLFDTYLTEYNDMEKRAIDSEAVDDYCNGLLKYVHAMGELLEKFEDAEVEA